MKKLQASSQWTQWKSENQTLLQTILRRAKEPFYNFEPYLNRTDAQPSFQWKFLRAADQYKGRLALAANRTGKSEIGAYDLCLSITGKHPYREYPKEGEALVIGLDYNMVRDVDRPVFEKFLPGEFKQKYHAGDQIWECSNGDRYWKVSFKSADSDPLKFEGTKLDKAWFDEEPKNTKVFTSVERGLIDKGGDWIFTATPLLGTAWLKALSERKDVFSVSGTMWDNPYLPQAEVESYAASLTPEEKLVRIEGHYLVFGGRPVFDIIGLRQLLDELKDHEKHPPPSQGYLLDAA